jgi:ABC-type transporter Mla MlaB component
MAAPASTTISFAVYGPIARADLPGLCDRVCALLGSSRPSFALCDVQGVQPDAVTVDALARLQLAARRAGCQVRLRNASEELQELVSFMGLEDVVLCVEPGGEPEEREQRLRVEEEGELDDAAL